MSRRTKGYFDNDGVWHSSAPASSGKSGKSKGKSSGKRTAVSPPVARFYPPSVIPFYRQPTMRAEDYPLSAIPYVRQAYSETNPVIYPPSLVELYKQPQILQALERIAPYLRPGMFTPDQLTPPYVSTDNHVSPTTLPAYMGQNVPTGQGMAPPYVSNETVSPADLLPAYLNQLTQARISQFPAYATAAEYNKSVAPGVPPYVQNPGLRPESRFMPPYVNRDLGALTHTIPSYVHSNPSAADSNPPYATGGAGRSTRTVPPYMGSQTPDYKPPYLSQTVDSRSANMPPYTQSPTVRPLNPPYVGGGSAPSLQPSQGGLPPYMGNVSGGNIPSVPQHPVVPKMTGSQLPAYMSAGANKNVVPNMLSPEQQAWAKAALGDTKGALEQAIAGGMSLDDFAKMLDSGGASAAGGGSGSKKKGTTSGGGGGSGYTQPILSYTPAQFAEFQKNTNTALGEINKAYGDAGSQMNALLSQYANSGAAQQAGAANTLQAFGVTPSANQVNGALPQDYLHAIQALMTQSQANQQSDLANRLNAYKALVG